jgi:hypothetical protein
MKQTPNNQKIIVKCGIPMPGICDICGEIKTMDYKDKSTGLIFCKDCLEYMVQATNILKITFGLNII